MRFEAGRVAIELAPSDGGRVASLRFDGHELLVGRDGDPMRWGAYPMVPWAGRVDRGQFEFGGRIHQLPITLGPHAIHGVAYTSTWTQIDGNSIGVDLGAGWPFGGRVEHSVVLTEDRVDLRLEVTAGDQAMPAMAGWHPWFRRSLDPELEPLELIFGAAAMYELDSTAIPTGALIEPPPGPWDNCFVGVRSGPTLTWPGVVRLHLTSSCRHWVVYDQPAHAICVEPQTDGPDVFNRDPMVLEPGQSLTAWFRIELEPLGPTHQEA